MSAREELTDEQRDIILNESLDLGQMLDAAFALGRESVDLAKHDAEVGTAERERLMGIRVPLLGRPGFSVSLTEFEEAYLGYGHHQSAERVCERGGFSYEELTKQLGHTPVSVRPIPGDRLAYQSQRNRDARATPTTEVAAHD